VIVVIPMPARGVTVTVRFAPEPPNTILESGTIIWFDELPESIKFAPGVSKSPIVHGNAPVLVFSMIVWSEISDTVGRQFPLLKPTETLSALLKAAAKSCLPSLLKSPIATERGLVS
jgi:hypothetical protein